jgi:hypothetical protein
MRPPHSFIPIENASPVRNDGSRHEILTVTPRASSSPLRFVQNDGVVRYNP